MQLVSREHPWSVPTSPDVATHKTGDIFCGTIYSLLSPWIAVGSIPTWTSLRAYTLYGLGVIGRSVLDAETFAHLSSSSSRYRSIDGNCEPEIEIEIDTEIEILFHSVRVYNSSILAVTSEETWLYRVSTTWKVRRVF